ncbi:MAG: cytidine deaminase [Chlorobi bacterium OLB7]|nr:MAG: cytidine deaminase [Chlorobi bacterium OLB7]
MGSGEHWRDPERGRCGDGSRRIVPILPANQIFLMNPEYQPLVDAARAALPLAQARYSGFRVAAALLCGDGTIVTGINVECSSYGGTICAERSALVGALSQGKSGFRAIAIATETEGPTMPCGICRQLLHDYAPGATVIAAGSNATAITTLRELLPHAFTL